MSKLQEPDMVEAEGEIMPFWNVSHHVNTVYEAETLEEAVDAYRLALIAELQSPIGKYSIGGNGPVEVSEDTAKRIRNR
jgi:hypothetical protein